MAHQTWIANKCREYGLEVIEVSGWQTRGSSSFNPKGVVAHHTASRTGSDAPALGICINGRSDLPGPLANIVLSRSGKVYIIAAGRANHAGSGGYMGLYGNSSVFGIEAENNGVGEPWSQRQLDAYYRVCAALLDGMQRGSQWVCGHKEWAPRRKPDPAGLDMNVFRSNVSGVKKGEKAQPVVKYNPKGSYKPESGNLTIWMHGERVGVWQAHLIMYAGQKIVNDGYFGPGTHDATINFQRFFGLVADGIVGDKTLGVMAYAKSQQEAAKAEAAKPQPAPKPTVDYSNQPKLQRGSRGEAVKVWQDALNKYAAQGLTVDGDFGTKTYFATFNFQKFFGLRADGMVGPKTWGVMEYVANTR